MHLFIAKFSNSGNVTWIQQPQSLGNGMSDGGVAVDPAGNVYFSGMYVTNLNFGGGIILTNAGACNAFLAKYNGSGAIQWARRLGAQTLVFIAFISTMSWIARAMFMWEGHCVLPQSETTVLRMR